jgi:hypothetical protein
VLAFRLALHDHSFVILAKLVCKYDLFQWEHDFIISEQDGSVGHDQKGVLINKQYCTSMVYHVFFHNVIYYKN